jgi:lipid-A-disaccharide synthase
MSSPPALLLTAFEPSGDALAARLIEALHAHHPALGLYALGGPKMAKAGATMLEQTTEHAAMGLSAASQALDHRRRMQRLGQWMQQHALAGVIPTDSPAANWAVCRLARRHQPQARILHLAAPQLWAWAPWRIRKMRRLSDRVLCLLPFEVDWFEARGMPATFVGHPLFDEPTQLSPRIIARRQQARADRPRLAILPGSRQAEVARNGPTMLAAFERLRQTHPSLRAIIVASDQARACQIRGLQADGQLPEQMRIVTGQPAATLQWADAALVVSGTASLQCVVHHRPMVVVYRVNRLGWHAIGRWLVRSRTFTLPNLLSESMGHGRLAPELVPHFGEIEPVVEALAPLMVEGSARQRQRAIFEAIDQAYAGRSFREAARDAVLDELAL